MDIDTIREQLILKHGKDKSYCKCGLPKKVIPQSQAKLGYCFFYTCGKPECSSRYGRKRPAHSLHMKQLKDTNPAYAQTIFKKGVKSNKNVNTIDFYRTKLKNLGYDIDSMDDSSVLALERTVRREIINRRSTKAKMFRTFVLKRGLESHFHNIEFDYLLSISDEEFKRLQYKKSSLHYFLCCFDKVGNKKYKKIEKVELKHNLRGITNLIVRSSYESNYIDFFEKNSIPWDYESIRIQLDGTSYTPDFLVDICGRQYILEVKGFLAEGNKESYLKIKINSAIEYARERNMGFLFSFKSNISSVEDLLSTEIIEEF